MRNRDVRHLARAVALILTCGVSSAGAQQNIDFNALKLQTVKVADGLFVLMGGPAQGNIVVSVGNDGMFLVDSMYGQMHQKIVEAIAALGPQPIRFLVNTHLHGDHTAGNAAMAGLGAVIVSHENMRRRMAEAPNAPPAGTLPILTYTTASRCTSTGRRSRSITLRRRTRMATRSSISARRTSCTWETSPRRCATRISASTMAVRSTA